MSTREADPSKAEQQHYDYHLKRDGLAMAGGFMLGLGGVVVESSATFTSGMLVMMAASLSIIVNNVRGEKIVAEHGK